MLDETHDFATWSPTTLANGEPGYVSSGGQVRRNLPAGAQVADKPKPAAVPVAPEPEAKTTSPESSDQKKAGPASTESTTSGPKKRDVQLGDEKLGKSKAQVQVSERVYTKNADTQLGEIYGKHTTIAQRYEALASSVGAPDDARVSVIHAGEYEPLYGDDLDMKATGVRVRIHHPDLSESSRFVGIDEHGKRFIKNEILVVKPEKAGNGLGTQIFAKQVENASAEGFDHILTHAAGEPGGKMNGFYTWPRFGYDQKVRDFLEIHPNDPGQFRKIKAAFPQAETVLDVMQAKGGREWWKANGAELVNAKFDLDPKSRSMKVLSAYVKERAAKSQTSVPTTTQHSTAPGTISKSSNQQFAEPNSIASAREELLALARHVHDAIVRLADIHSPEPVLPPAAARPSGQLPLDEVAPAGKDGVQAARLMQASKDKGAKVLYYLSRRATARLLANPGADSFFDADELAVLQRAIAATTGTAELLGRSRIRERARHVEEARAGVSMFSEADTFEAFADPPPPLPPQRAIEYFQRLVPELNVDPLRFGPLQQRNAFTMAVRADQVLLERVKGLISTGLESGGTSGIAPRIQHLLEDAGVAPKNLQYSEMLWRSNAMDSYTHGIQAEMQQPEMAELFPVWHYLGILDGRQGKDHEPRFDLYYPNSVSFHEVRGERIFNCRCAPNPIDRYLWQELQAGGARVETNW